MNSNTRKPVQDQERETNDHDVDDTIFLVNTEGDVRNARCFGMNATELDWFLEEFETLDNLRLVVVSAFNAYSLAKMVIERYGPRIDVRFVDLEGQTLESMAKKVGSRLRLCHLIENPWHMTKTSGSC